MSFEYPTQGPGSPWYTGSYSLEPVVPSTATIDGIDYVIDTKRYRHRGLPRLREGVATSGEPSDEMFNNEGAWWRYRFSWHHGAGQEVVDLDTQRSDPARFLASRGVDPWDRYELKLLAATAKKLDITAAGIILIATGDHCYVGYGTTVKRSADLTTWSDVTGLTGNVLSITTDGYSVYVGTSTGVYQVSPSSLNSSLLTGSTPVTGHSSIAFVSNKLLAGDGNRLVDVDGVTLGVIYTHFQPTFRWTTIFAVGSRIYVGGFAGNRSELYSLSTTESGDLAISSEAASFFSNELLQGAVSYGGSVILHTSRGLRFAVVGGDGTLQYGPLIDAPGDVRCATAEGRFTWFGWENFPLTGTGLGRLALDDFVNQLQPAYATDVFTEDKSDPVVAVCRFEGRTVFAVSEEGVYATTDNYVTEGYLDTGHLYVGTVEDKSMTELQVKFATLAAGESITATMYDENGVVLETDSVTTGEALTLDIDGQSAFRTSIRIELVGPGTSTPVVRHWRARGYPVAPATEAFIVPLLIHSAVLVNDGAGQIQSMDVWDAIVTLRTLWINSTVFLFRLGEHAFRVRMDQFEVDEAHWNDDHSWFESVCTVRLLTT